MTDLPSHVGAGDLARLLGTTTTRVSALAREGVIPRAGRGRYPVPDSVRAYIGYAKTRGEGRTPARADLNAAKLRHVNAQAEIAEQKAAQARGDLLDAREVHARWVSTVTGLRAALLATPARVAAQSGLDRAAAALLDAELRAALDQIAAEGERQSMSAHDSPDSPSPAPTPAESPSAPQRAAHGPSDDPDVEDLLA